MAKLKLDLHDIYNRGYEIDAELNRIVEEAIERKIELVEIIPGKGSGQLKKKVLRFLNQGHIKKLYHRVEKDDKNFGRIFIHFKFLAGRDKMRFQPVFHFHFSAQDRNHRVSLCMVNHKNRAVHRNIHSPCADNDPANFFFLLDIR